MKNKTVKRLFCSMLSAAVIAGSSVPCDMVLAADTAQDGVQDFCDEEGGLQTEGTDGTDTIFVDEAEAEIGDANIDEPADQDKSREDAEPEQPAADTEESGENVSEELTPEEITQDFTDDAEESDVLNMEGTIPAGFEDETSDEEYCEIFFDGNGSSTGTMDPLKNCAVDGETVLPANQFQRTGYQFAGWNTAADGTGTSYQNSQKVTGLFSQAGESVTLYAQWKANTYHIVFKGNKNTGGSTAAMKNCSYGSSTALRRNGFARTNYVFTGWNTRADGKGQKYANGQKVSGLTAKNGGTVTLYAQWRMKQYTVAFSGNHSTSGTMKNMTCQYTKRYKLTACTYKRKGYTFTGWNTRADGKGKVYKNAQSIRNLSSKDSAVINLYACWKKNTYKISYQLNGGKNASNPKTYTVTSDITLKKPIRTGYTFKGWYLDKSLTKKVTKIAKGSTGNKTLYAKWSVNQYTIQYMGNGGKGDLGKFTVKVGQSGYLPLGGYSRDGYYCTGWNTRADGKGKQYGTLQLVKNLSTKNGATVKLYATWKALGKNEISMSKQVIAQVNKERKARGLKALKTNSVLNGIAQQRAKEIAQYFDHQRPDGTMFVSMYSTAGYSYSACGENIAYGQRNAASVMNSWMHSEGHKANILSSSFEEIGVGCYYQNGVYYWVQNFGTQWSWNW